MPEDVNSLIQERGSRYGSFDDHANITQGIKDVMRQGRSWGKCTFSMREALEMIAHKIGRIVNGDPFYKDSWDDIEGYSRLVSKELEADNDN